MSIPMVYDEVIDGEDFGVVKQVMRTSLTDANANKDSNTTTFTIVAVVSWLHNNNRQSVINVQNLRRIDVDDSTSSTWKWRVNRPDDI